MRWPLLAFPLALLLGASLPMLVLSTRAEWLRIGVRVAGGWIAAIGSLMIGVAQRARRSDETQLARRCRRAGSSARA